MRLLLDTQVWLWMIAAPERLSAASRALLEEPRNELLFSAASSWEIAVKAGLGKIRAPEPVDVWVPRVLAESGVVPFPVLHSHTLAVAALRNHHRDPFDRLLVAQATIESVPILTSDPAIARYDVEVLPA